MWRLIYSKHKLYLPQRTRLQSILDGYSYSCGAQLKDLNLDEEFKDVEVKDHVCGSPIEKLYYSAGFDPICIYCAADQPHTVADQYPQCTECSDLPPIKK